MSRLATAPPLCSFGGRDPSPSRARCAADPLRRRARSNHGRFAPQGARRGGARASPCVCAPPHLPAEVLDAVVVVAAQLGVEARQDVAQVVEAAQARRQLAAGDAGEELVGGEGGEAAVGGVDVELGDGAGDGLEGPPGST